MWKRLVAIALFAVSCVSAQQLPSHRRSAVVALRDTHSQVWAKLGFPPIRTAGLRQWLRKTSSNEFRIQTDYYVDDSLSKLHPEYRLLDIEYSPDKREPWKKILRQLAEVRNVCAQGCRAVGQSTMFGTEIIACHSTPEFTTESALSITPSGEACVQVEFEMASRRPHTEADWDSLDVERVVLGLLNPKYAFRRSDLDATGVETDFGLLVLD